MDLWWHAARRDTEPRQPPRKIVATYPYMDEHGVTLFEAIRFDPKGFAQRAPDGHGGHVWSIKGVRLVPYRLPELVAAIAAGDPVHVVEGEKDADAVHDAGGVATCNPMGAGKWRTEYAEHFRGASDVRIVADRDTPGYQHAAQVAASLRAVGATVRVLEAATGKDASDHLAAGRTLEELVEVDLEVADPAGGAVVDLVPEPSSFLDERGRDLQVERLARYIENEGHVLVGEDGRLYWYDAGVYRADGGTFARARVRDLLGPSFKRRYAEEVSAWLSARFPTLPARPPVDILNLRNGVLRWADGTLEPHSPAVLSTIQLPVAWNPTAECPVFVDFISAVLPAESIDFLFELLGYLLYTGNPLRIAVLLLGLGRNGKSTLLHLIVGLLGERNVCTIPLQVLAENRFAAAELYGRLANVCGDLDARAIRHTDTFKILTGGDRMMAERKHQAPFTFMPYAVPVFSANEAPISSDQTDGWFDRWIVVPMERRLREDEVDPSLPGRLTAASELEGVLVRAVEGLRRLMERGRFELPEIVRRGREDYRERLDTAAGFASECIQINPTVWTSRQDVYATYRAWCERSGRLPVSAQSFKARICDAFGDRIEERKREGTRGWAGLSLTGGGV